MSIELAVKPPFRDDWTDVTIAGENEDEVAAILAARLISSGYEVSVEDENGELIPYEEYEV
jgi:hypothetical protein